MQTFLEFLDIKEREALKHLKIIKQILEDAGFKTKTFLKEEDPYIYVQNTNNDGDFGGVRVYEIGDLIAYRVQNESKTEPYGKSYQLDIEGMFKDLLYDHRNPEKAGKVLIKALVKEMKDFFIRSEEAQKSLMGYDQDLSPNNPMNRILQRVTTGPDYGNLVYWQR